MAVWGRGDSSLVEGCGFEVWGRMGGGGVGLPNLVGVFMGVVYGEVFVKVGRYSANTSVMRLGWGIG